MTTTPSKPIDSAVEFHIGRKRLYAMFRGDEVTIMSDCIMTPLAMMKLVITRGQYEEFNPAGGRRMMLMQDIFPKMDPRQRELLISGTTPAEWQEMCGLPQLPRSELAKLGYEWEDE